MATAPILQQLTIEVLTECHWPAGCDRLTSHSDLCWQHAEEMWGVRVRPSLIPGAELGLFASTRSFKRGDVICPYLGKVMSGSDFRALPSAYGVQLSGGRVLDARRTSDGLGRYACSASSVRGRNAQLITEHKLLGRGSGSKVFLQATKRIADGDEVLLYYEFV